MSCQFGKGQLELLRQSTYTLYRMGVVPTFIATVLGWLRCWLGNYLWKLHRPISTDRVHRGSDGPMPTCIKNPVKWNDSTNTDDMCVTCNITIGVAHHLILIKCVEAVWVSLTIAAAVMACKCEFTE